MGRYLLLLFPLLFLPRVSFADVRLAVLEFRGAGVSQALLPVLTDEVRSGVLHMSDGQKIDGENLLIMTKENMMQVLKDQGLSAEDCTGSCEVELAKNIGADYVISGNISKVGSLFILGVKMHATSGGNLLASESLKTKSEEALITEAEKLGAEIFQKGLKIKERPNNNSKESGFVDTEEKDWRLNEQGESSIVSFKSTPSKAIVIVDGKVLCSQTPCSKSIPLGKHTVSIQKETYTSWNQNLNVKKGTKVEAELKPEFAFLDISSPYKDVAFFLDGKSIGKTPLPKTKISLGNHRVTVQDPCYTGKEYKFKSKAGQTETLTNYPLKPRPAGIDVSVTDDGNDVAAKIYVDNKAVGKSPGRFQVPVCSQEITVRYKGKSESKRLRLKEKTTKEVSFSWASQKTKSKKTKSKNRQRSSGKADWLFQRSGKSSGVPSASYQLKLEASSISLQDYTFPSGLRILFHADQTQPGVTVHTVIDRGSEQDPYQKDGVAHVVESLQPYVNHAGVRNIDLIKQMGGSIHSSTNADSTHYMVVAPRDTLAALLRIEALRMKNGLVNITEPDLQHAIESQKRQRWARHENSSVNAVWDDIDKALFPSAHPYARTTVGNHKTLNNINLSEAQNFVRTNYRPEYTTIFVKGDFELSDMGSLLMKAFTGSEELLMTPKNAAKFKGIQTRNEQIRFLNTENPIRLSQNPTPPRVTCKNRQAPPPVRQNGGVKTGGDEPHWIFSWSLPGAYCSDQSTMNMSAFMLENYILRTLFPNFQARSHNHKKVGCSVHAGEYASKLICFVEKSDLLADYSDTQITEKIEEALAFSGRSFGARSEKGTYKRQMFFNAKTRALASVLQSTDAISDVSSARAAERTLYTHFTADASYSSSTITAINQIGASATEEFIKKWINKNRMVSIVVEASTEDGRYHSSHSPIAKRYLGKQDSSRYASLFRPSQVDKSLIASHLPTSDMSKLHRFTLSNGLKVAILDYGKAPLVHVHYTIKGDTVTAGPMAGFDDYAQSSLFTADYGNPLAAVGGAFRTQANAFSLRGSSGNLDAVLHQLRVQLDDIQLYDASYGKRFLEQQISSAKDMTPFETASKTLFQNVLPEYSTGKGVNEWDWLALKKAKPKQIKKWLYTKTQPANAELFIVGKLDPQKAERFVRMYFKDLSAPKDVSVGALSASTPRKKSKHSVFLIDHPRATQTQIRMACRLDSTDSPVSDSKNHVVSEALAEMLWRSLRKTKSVADYTDAYSQRFNGGAAILEMRSSVQNDSVGAAVSGMLDIVRKAAAGKTRDDTLANAKIKTAHLFAQRQSSAEQMVKHLSRVGIENIQNVDKIPATLAAISQSDVQEVLAPCRGGEIFTLVGPLRNSEKHLNQQGISYVVVKSN